MSTDWGEFPSWVCQPDADIGLEWGPHGLRALASGADAVVVFDVLRFTTAVDVAVSSGLRVLAHRWDRDDDAAALALRTGAVLASKRGPGPSLSPASLRGLAAGTRIILPSPNGSALIVAAAATGATTVIDGELVNGAPQRSS